MSNETQTGAEILKAAIGLGPKIQDAREEIERERHLPMPLVEAMKQAGVFRMPMPREWGGPELDPISQLRVLEALSTFDASVGWCAMLGCDGGYFTSFIDQKIAREMYRDLDAVTGSALTLTGRAVPAEGGYRVSGRWPFSSGCQHSTWLVAGCMVSDGDRPRLRGNGTPETRQCYLPAAECQILDTWYATGLRGSGSHDFTIKDYFVPAERSFSYQELTFRRSGPLYRFPFNILFKFAGPPLGVARAAIDSLVEAATNRPARATTIAGKATPPKMMREEAFVQAAVGKAEATLRSSRSYLFDVIGAIFETLSAGREISLEQGAHFAMVNTHVFAACSEVVELMYKVRGGSAVYSNGTLERCLRDILTMNQHVSNSLKHYDVAGRLLLGLPPEEFLL